MSERKKGSTSNTLQFRLVDSTTGAEKTGLTVTGLKLQYKRPGESPSTATSLTAKAAFNTAFAAYAAKEADATNSAGIYDVDCPDAAFATGADEVVLSISGSGVATSSRLVDLMAVDARDAVRGGMTALPNAVAAANGGLPTVDASNGVKLSVGTGTGQVNLASGKAPATVASGDLTLSTDQITAASVSAAAVTKIQAGLPAATATAVWTDTTAGDFTTASSPGKFLLVQLAGTLTGTTSVFTTASLVNAPTGGSAPTAAAIATAVWTDTTAGDFTVTGSPGKFVLAQLAGAFVGTTSVYSAPALANGPGGAGADPWLTDVSTGTYTGTEAGHLLYLLRLGVNLTTVLGNAVLPDPTAQAGGASTITLVSSDTTGDNIYRNRKITLTGGTGAGQSAVITANVSSTKVATVTPAWLVVPDSTTTYAIGETAIVPDPLLAAVPGSYSAGTAGYVLGHNLDAQVSTRSIYAGGPVASVTAAVTVGTNNDKSGYALSAAGLDAIVIETAVNARQALSVILASAAGVLSGATSGASTVVVKGGAVATTRITATTDSSGNRTAVTLALPT